MTSPLLTTTAASAEPPPMHDSPQQAIAQAHDVLWQRFIGPEGLIHDYEGELPTPQDCADCRPNAMGWWSPIENGPMFTGSYLAAMVRRALRTGDDNDRDQCRRLAEGLLLTASVSDTPGMIIRGVGTDGRCHYPLGSCDQTIPWFFGLDAYVRSPLCPEPLRRQFIAKMTEVGQELARTNWCVPSDGPFTGEYRGDFAADGLPFRGATHFLFILKSLADVTGAPSWQQAYLTARDENYPGLDNHGAPMTRLAVCEAGYRIDHDLKHFPVEPSQLWIYVCAQGCLAELAARETDPLCRQRYLAGLRKGGEWAAGFLAAGLNYPNTAERPFRYANWRNGWRWKPQKTQQDAEDVARSPIPEIIGNRKTLERNTMTAPLAAAAICAYANAHQPEIARLLCHYDYTTLALCEFFLAEVAWYSFPLAWNSAHPLRVRGIPFTITADVPNAETKEAIQETIRIASDPNIKGYSVEEALQELKK